MAEKQSAFDMKICRYPHVESCMPEPCYIGCVVASINQAAQFSEHDADIAENFKDLAELMVQRGFIPKYFEQGNKRSCKPA